MAVTLETIARDAACNAIVDLIDAGAGAGGLELKTAGGTSARHNGQVAEMTLSDPAFGASSSGVATLDVTPAVEDTNADGGTATKAYFYDSNDAAVLSCSVGVGSGDISLTNNVIAATETVTITSLTVTVPAS